jgi:diacylglycerol kinase (ATP)
MKHPPHLKFIPARIRSFVCAIKGVVTMLGSEPNARIHAVTTFCVIAAGIYFGFSRGEWCLVLLAVVAVWTAEALNTAFELLTDLASPEFHPLAEKAKDVAAGAVLITALGALIIGLLVIVPHVLARLN